MWMFCLLEWKSLNEDINFILKNLKELKKIYPDIVSIVDGWQQLAKIHGISQTEYDKKTLEKYVKILKNLGVINE